MIATLRLADRAASRSPGIGDVAMDELIGWVMFLSVCFGIYVLGKLANLRAEVDGLKVQVARLTGRGQGEATPVAPLRSLAEALDARQGIDPYRSRPASRPAPPPCDTAAAPEFVIQPPGPVLAPVSALGQPPSPQKPPKPARVPPSQPFDIESVVGANWMAKLGIAAIAVSVAFFLQYAFRNGWVKPWGQVGIGLCGAVAMMGAGQFMLTKERFRSYAQTLSSGGIVVYFLSIYAAYSFYQPELMGYWPAFGALAVGAIAASGLALANRTEAVAVICILGAFAAPALIRDHGGTSSPDGLFKLYVYLAAINLWAVAFIRFRAWYSVAIVSFMCTWLLFLAAGPVTHGGWRTECFATLFLLSAIWTGVKSLYASSGEAKEGESGNLQMAGIGIIVAASFAFVFSSATILSDLSNLGFPDVAVAGTMTGLLLAALAVGLPPTETHDASMRKGFAILSSLAIGGVMAVAFLNAPPVPAGQVGAAFGFTLLNYALFFAMAHSLRKREGTTEPAALLIGVNAAVHILMALHVLAQTQVAGVPAACLWLPVAALLTLGGVWLTTEEENAPMLVPATLAFAAQSFSVAALLRALAPNEWHFVAHWPATATWLLAGEFLLASAAWVILRNRIAWPQLRMDAVGAFGNALVFFAMMAWAVGAQKFHGLSLPAAWSVIMAAWHGLVGGILLSGDEEDDLHRYSYLGLAVTFLTIAIPLQLEMAWITVAWAVEAAAIVWSGTAAKSKTARSFGYTVLAIAACRAMLVDLIHPLEPFHFFFNSRMLAGSAVVIAGCVSAWLLWKNRESLESGETNLPSALVVLANLFTLAFVSVELWERFGPTVGGAAEGDSLQHLALTVFWAVYALCAVAIGTVILSRPIGALGLCLLAFAAAKAITMDFTIEPAHFSLLMNARMYAGFAVVVAAYLSAWLMWDRRDEMSESEQVVPGGLILLANAYTLAFVSRDLWQRFGGQTSGVVSAQQLALSIFWALYGLVAICVGIWNRRRTMRLFAMGLLYVAIFKVFLYDLRQLETPYRIASFFTLGVVFLLVSYLYTRFEERLREDDVRPPAPRIPRTPPTIVPT